MYTEVVRNWAVGGVPMS